MKVVFSPREKSILTGILDQIKLTVSDRRTKRVLSLIANKVQYNSLYAKLKSGEISLLIRILDIAKSQAEKAGIKDERIHYLHLADSTIRRALAERGAKIATDQNG